MSKRCAVVTGVSRTGGLPPLVSVVPGAKEIADLLRRNDYDVETVTDENGDVTVARITEAIDKFITRQQTVGYDLLVVYFSGHGYWKNETDLWLLSRAPGNAGDNVFSSPRTAVLKTSS